MESWLQSATEYILRWIEFQVRASQQPGCIVAIAHRGKVVAEYAFGHANLVTGEKLTPRHRFRIASHSKAFTSTGIMKLRERRKLRLDDSIGHYVKGLHPQVAEVTVAQILSHSAGLIRDGIDSGQFIDSRPYLTENELLTELRLPTAIEPNTRFKYSNHGFGLLGLLIEAITGEPYSVWIKREIVDAAGLHETVPNMPIAKNTPFARGHSGRLPLGRRVVIPGDNPANAMTPAAGFVSTAADTARFFAQLAPNAKRSVISAASRRELTRKQWRIPHSSLEAYYGFGIVCGNTAGWDYFGHGGGFQGYISRTCVIPACEVTITVPPTASTAGLHFGLMAPCTSCAPSETMVRRNDAFGTGPDAGGPCGPRPILCPWEMWLLPPIPTHLGNPFLDATEIEVTGRDTGRIVLATGYGSHGERVRRTRSKAGIVTDIWLAGINAKPEKKVAAEMKRRYAPRKRPAG